MGVAAIKEHGGVTFAQAEDTAKFDMMPRNAIATGQIDFVLSPEAIAQELIRFSVHPSIQDNKTNIEALVPEAEHFHQILMLLLKASGIDFRNYKSTTITRRILRRMMLNKVDTLKNYVTSLLSRYKLNNDNWLRF